jgi:cellulose 1,4-beta-cellobiosidase
MHKRTCMKTALFLVLAATGCATAGVGAVAPGSEKNPFKDVNYFLNPEFVANVEATAKRHPEMAEQIRKVAQYPSAGWLDSIGAVKNLKVWLDEAKKQQDASGKPTLTVVIVYDLPNRDCSAEASAGELKVAQNGLQRYKTEFIDAITAEFKAHASQPIAVVLEPDSLGNLATNMSIPACVEARPAYKEGVIYAIKSFALPNVSVYLDAAHSGWLGWDDNRTKIAKIFRQVLAEAGGPGMIRGFATNTSNYTSLSNRDGAVLEPTNPCPNELTYVKTLRKTLEMSGFRNHGFIIDTARNGRGGIRHAWGNWCNIKGAGLGERPRADPAPDQPEIDAFFWLKPPGESDGVADKNAPRFDPMCAGQDAAPNAPQAGQWFESYFLDLVRNANPPL